MQYLKKKKGKTKKLDVVYLLKRINGLCNFNFYFKVMWPPLATIYSPPLHHHQNKNFWPSPTKLEGGGASHACFLLLHEWVLETCFTWYFIRISYMKYQINSFKLNGSLKFLVISKYMISNISNATDRWKEDKWLAN